MKSPNDDWKWDLLAWALAIVSVIAGLAALALFMADRG